MGFGGGGSAGMTNHVHNSVPLQGGPLDFANDTIASLNVGSTTFSDGAALQELVIGNAADTLVVNGAGNAPEWAAPGGGAWVQEGNDINTTPGTSLDVSVSDADVYQILYNVADGGGGPCSLTMRINGVNTAGYKALLGNALDAADIAVGLNNETKFLLSGGGTQRQFSGVIYVYKSDSNFDPGVQGVTFVQQGGTMDGTDPYTVNVSNGGRQSITGAITQISLLCMKDTTAVNENIEGSMRVNSLTYS